VTKPETINYRTLKPRRTGLCERIFGPTEGLGVLRGQVQARALQGGSSASAAASEVTRSKVRRERMGHIDLAAPVSHIWFFKGVPAGSAICSTSPRRKAGEGSLFAPPDRSRTSTRRRARRTSKLEKEVKKVSTPTTRSGGAPARVARSLDRRLEYMRSGKQTGFSERGTTSGPTRSRST